MNGEKEAVEQAVVRAWVELGRDPPGKCANDSFLHFREGYFAARTVALSEYQRGLEDAAKIAERRRDCGDPSTWVCDAVMKEIRAHAAKAGG